VKLSYIILPILAANIAWVVIGAIRDCRKTDKTDVWSRIDRNTNIAIRNIKFSAINVGLAIIIIVCGRMFHLQW